jgi:hypothetical protein
MKKTTKKDPVAQLVHAKEVRAIDTFIYYVLLATILIVPIVLNIHNVNFISPVVSDNTFMMTGMKTNLFTAVKLGWLVFFASLIIIAMLYRFNKGSFVSNARTVYIGLLLMVFGIVLSTLASPAKTIAIFGDYQRHEGALAWLAYLTLFFAAFTIEWTEERIQKVAYFLYPFVLINFFLGVMNFFNYDVLGTNLVKSLVGIGAGVNISAGSRLLATLPNINYVSGVSAVMIGLFLTWAVFDQNFKRSLINLGVALLAVTTLFVSLSNSGFVTLLLLLVIIAILLFKSQNIKKSLLVFTGFIVACIVIFYPLASYNERTWDESVGILVSTNPFAEKVGVAPVVAAKQTVSNNSEYLPVLPEVKVGAGSGRVYIWEETLRSIQEKPVLGYGLDTFTYYLNQDKVEKASNLGDPYIVIDKAHNMFLGYAMGTGIVSLVGMLMLIIIVIVKGIIQAFTKKMSIEQVPKVSLLLASTAFFFQGLFNDSILGVGTIAWILFGVLASVVVNQMKKTE